MKTDEEIKLIASNIINHIEFTKNTNLEHEETKHNVLTFATRANGNKDSESASNIDIEDARKMGEALKKLFLISFKIEEIDEWVYLRIIITL